MGSALIQCYILRTSCGCPAIDAYFAHAALHHLITAATRTVLTVKDIGCSVCQAFRRDMLWYIACYCGLYLAVIVVAVGYVNNLANKVGYRAYRPYIWMARNQPRWVVTLAAVNASDRFRRHAAL